jgi:tRNA-dihydrouridine synthase B
MDYSAKKDWDSPIEYAMPEQARVPAGFAIGPVQVAPATVLAPMVGVTDTIFRRFIRNSSLFTANATPASGNDGVETAVSNQQSGCGLLMTEFTSADGLARMRESKRKRYLTFYDDEHPISAQIFGANPETLAEAARIVQDTGFDVVDLNLGCPAKRVVACNGGSGLLRDLPLIAKIFEAVRGAVSIPFTVKFRMGWNDKHIVCVELARLAQESGLAAVALHARTREDGYSGQARWEWIAAVKDAVSIPVIGNGDIRTPEDACAMVEQTNCDAVMIGRAAPSNPWIFRQIAQYTATGRYDHPTEADRYALIRSYFTMLLNDAAEHGTEPREAQGKMKQFASWFTHGVPGGAGLRKAIYEAKTGPVILDAVERFFEPRLPGLDALDVTGQPADDLSPHEAAAQP